MSGKPKPGVDWASIRIEWEAGGSASDIARRHPVTRQAIEHRRNRYSWVRDEAAAALCETPTGKRVTAPQNRHDRKLIANGKRSLANMRLILEVLASGGSPKLAAQRTGMAADTLREWLASDAEFARLAEAAQAEAGVRAIERVTAAGTRGDWRADAYLLEKMPATREDFAPRPSGAPMEGAGVAVQIVFRTDAGALLNVAPPDRPAVNHDAPPLAIGEGSADG